MDYPGHFCHRLVSVAVSLSNVPVKPTNISCTLTLQQHKYRTSTSTSPDSSRPIDQYAPLEGAGAVSSWQIIFPTNLRRFDYGEITDVVLHVRYTAFSSGGLLDQAALDAVAGWKTAGEGNSYYGDTAKILAINLADEYPDEWEAFLESGDMQLPCIKDKLPFWARKGVKLENPTLYITPDLSDDPTIESSADKNSLSKSKPSSDFGSRQP